MTHVNVEVGTLIIFQYATMLVIDKYETSFGTVIRCLWEWTDVRYPLALGWERTLTREFRYDGIVNRVAQGDLVVLQQTESVK